MKSEKDKCINKMQRILVPQIRAAQRKVNGVGGFVADDHKTELNMLELKMFKWFYNFLENYKDDRDKIKRL